MSHVTTPDPLTERRRSRAEHAGTIRAHFPWWDTQVRPGLLRLVSAFPQKDLDFKPRPELLTVRELVVHIAEAERAWVYCVLEGSKDEDWVVPQADPSQGFRLLVDAPDHASPHRVARAMASAATQAWFDRPEADLAFEIYSSRRAVITPRTGSWTACTSTRSITATSSVFI
jgi:hypothetical protein